MSSAICAAGSPDNQREESRGAGIHQVMCSSSPRRRARLRAAGFSRGHCARSIAIPGGPGHTNSRLMRPSRRESCTALLARSWVSDPARWRGGDAREDHRSAGRRRADPLGGRPAKDTNGRTAAAKALMARAGMGVDRDSEPVAKPGLTVHATKNNIPRLATASARGRAA